MASYVDLVDLVFRGHPDVEYAAFERLVVAPRCAVRVASGLHQAADSAWASYVVLARPASGSVLHHSLEVAGQDFRSSGAWRDLLPYRWVPALAYADDFGQQRQQLQRQRLSSG